MGVARGWLPLTDAAKYVGLNPNVLKRAVNEGKLKAYRKPETYRGGGRVYALLSVEDIDEWVRSLPQVRFDDAQGAA